MRRDSIRTEEVTRFPGLHGQCIVRDLVPVRVAAVTLYPEWVVL